MNRSFALLVCFALTGCDDHLFPNPKEDTTLTSEGYCGVQELVAGGCLGCHSAGSAQGGLDLETDAHAALVGVASAAYGVLLVDPGNPAGSLFYTKLAGTQELTQGGSMPPSGTVDSATLGVLEAWITGGADAVCSQAPPTPTGRVHPDGWSAPDVHGMAAKFQELDCRTCHGAELDGGIGPACSSCHPSDWKTTCTYCHGGVASTTGAPPQDIDDNVDLANSPYRPHTEHLQDGDHAPIPCETCHLVPTSA